MPNITCLCGEVEIAIGGEPLAHVYCHCDDCQLVHTAAYVPAAIYRNEDIAVVRGEPREFRLRVTPRLSCPNCGTRLLSQGSERYSGVSANLLPAGSFRPVMHIHCKFAVLPVKDDLPHYATVPERWGGSDDQVDWG